MYGTLIINTDNCAYEHKTNEYDSIYDRLIALTDDHPFSEDVASWAEIAAFGEEYYGADEYGLEIFICEEA